MASSHASPTSMPQAASLLTADGTLGWRGLLPQPILVGPGTCHVSIQTTSATDRQVVLQAVIQNPGPDPIQLRKIRWSMPTRPTLHAGMKFSPELDPFYFATENFRGDYYGPGTTRGHSYFDPMPTVTTELGWSEDHVFPGLFIGAGRRECGLFCAALQAVRFHLIFRLRGHNDAGDYFFEIDELPTGVETLTIAPGEALTGEQIFFNLCSTSNPQHATAAYYDLLRKAGIFTRRKDNPLVQQRIWCSWNYDYFANITQEDVLKQLPILTHHFPSVKFVQIDDGYQRRYAHGHRGFIDIVYDGDEPFDREKFPDGATGLTRAIKAAGLRPAIWMGLWAAMESPMIHDHPDWILRDDAGNVMQFGSPEPSSSYGTVGTLDPSIPAVREYIEHLCRTAFGAWGFEGVKLDFSSFAFECKRVRFKYPGKTALQWRRWLVETFRKYLPIDGFFGWCVVCGTGDPLLAGEGADYFRCSEDIGSGSWALVKNIAAWCANTNMLMQQRPIFPNIDSIGWSRHWNETQWTTWLNLAAVTGAALELGGDLTKLNPAQMQRLNSTLVLSNPTRRVWCADVARGPVAHPPSLWIAQGESEILIGMFNWEDATRRVHLPTTVLDQLGLVQPSAQDAWNGQATSLPLANSPLLLAPHTSLLLRVNHRRS